MTSKRPKVLTILIAMLVLTGPAGAPAAVSPPAAEAGKTGDLWEVTTKMSMEGMEMPGRTMKVCTPKEWKEPPAPADEQQKCRYSDFKVVGSRATWKVRCTNPEMTGEGEVTRNGADSYAGVIKFTSDQGVMRLKLDGKRVGDCDPAKP